MKFGFLRLAAVFCMIICQQLSAQVLGVMNDSIAALQMGKTARVENESLIKQCFANMPDSLESVLTRNNRLDAMDFLANNMKAIVKNRFSKTSELRTMTDDYLDFQTSPLSSFQIKILPSGTENIICMVKTVCAPLCESEIHFYDWNWQEQTVQKYFEQPAAQDFLTSSTEQITDVPLYKIELDSAANTLMLSVAPMDENSISLDPEVSKNKEKFRKIQFEWQNGMFVKKE